MKPVELCKVIVLLSLSAVLLSLATVMLIVGLNSEKVMSDFRNDLSGFKKDASELVTSLKSDVSEFRQSLVNSANESSEMLKQTKLAVMSAHGLSFDVRKNLTSNTVLQTKILDTFTSSMEKMVSSTDRSMDRMASKVETVLDFGMNMSAPLFAESVKTIQTVNQETIPRFNVILDTTAKTVDNVNPILDQTAQVVGATNYLMCQIGEIAESGSIAAKYYEKKLTNPSWYERIKGFIGLGGFAVSNIYMPLWGSYKVKF